MWEWKPHPSMRARGVGTPLPVGKPWGCLRRAPLGPSGCWRWFVGRPRSFPDESYSRLATSCTTEGFLCPFQSREALFFQGPETGIYVFPARQAQPLPPFSFSLKKNNFMENGCRNERNEKHIKIILMLAPLPKYLIVLKNFFTFQSSFYFRLLKAVSKGKYFTYFYFYNGGQGSKEAWGRTHRPEALIPPHWNWIPHRTFPGWATSLDGFHDDVHCLFTASRYCLQILLGVTA